ncbi:sigma-70 family RNA polymerase sigma factor [Aquimarina algicola]|uniref:Sigma-70 family RNA polymerase sigma factor n=2 Tax=Aquimarina algicola TaxID=2589995 RepID=A0A504JH67_9FLAO|nr:sigma-70 family RNA polymerase sigma factor [Aquimarina algicola]
MINEAELYPESERHKLSIAMDKDQIMITGIINGDERILSNFYKENIRYVQGYILQNFGNAEDVEDIFQDALVVLYQKLKSEMVEMRVPVTTYFYGICKNLWKNRLRKKQRLVVDDKRVYFEEESNDIIIHNIENKEREHLYRKHFQKLSSENRKLLHLFFEGKSMKEISKITGYTVGYARKKKFLAKKQLLKMIEQDPLYEELKVVC